MYQPISVQLAGARRSTPSLILEATTDIKEKTAMIVAHMSIVVNALLHRFYALGRKTTRSEEAFEELLNLMSEVPTQIH